MEAKNRKSVALPEVGTAFVMELPAAEQGDKTHRSTVCGRGSEEFASKAHVAYEAAERS